MKKDTLTGVIPTEGKPIVFSSQNDYEFCFLTDMIYKIGEKNDVVKIPTVDGFLFGKTHENNDVAIYVGGKEFIVFLNRTITTGLYVKSSYNVRNRDIKDFDTICFQGGTLNKLFKINGIKTDLADGTNTVELIDDSERYHIETNGYSINLVVRSITTERMGLEGRHIANDNVELTLKFDKPQPLKSLIEHYNKIKDLLSFMTFRENVGFDKIYIGKESSKTAEVFMREDKEFTDKNHFNNIHFDELGESLPKLLKLLYNSEDKKSSLSLGFIPKDDNDFFIMNNDKIRLICTALECELSFAEDIKVEENKELDELIETIKSTIKEFRKTHTKLSNDVYNSISSNMGHWSFPLAEKLCALHHKYEEEMLIINKNSSSITDENIKAVVKYRNDITHGKHRVSDMEIARTAFYLCGLIYFCILERVGVDRKNIKEWCKHQLLT
ncbi:MAG: hypothetical protein IJ945_02065 [Oscillospiraceae bacterium]|nr:hypothetical protein [Oscillospiraceae bacterium]